MGAYLFFTIGPGLVFGSGAISEGEETGAVDVLMVVEVPWHPLY